jgi:putative ABC transport system permease protein
MLGYHLRMALKSLRRTPGLTLLMTAAIGLGVSACIVTLTEYHAMSSNPIWWKNSVLYAVTLDIAATNQPNNPRHPGLPPAQLTYPDATYLARSSIPQRTAIMAVAQGALDGAPDQSVAVPVETRVTTAGFFHMFDVPFKYGGPWNATADRGPQPVIVLSRRENDRLFGGADSVGRTLLWNNHRFRIVGVLDHWDPRPRFYDMTVGNFVRPEAAFIPLKWITALHMWPSGQMQCWGKGAITYSSLRGPGCIWLEMWAELPTAASRARFLALMNAYATEQRKSGRFNYPLNARLWNVGQWLRLNDAVTHDSRLLLRLAFTFLAVCLINTVAVLLAKFMGAAPLAGIRRALGASRREIIAQHLIEASLVSLAGSCLALVLTVGELQGIRALYRHTHDVYGKLAHFDPLSLLWALALTVLSTLVAGLYPAWRAGQVAPAAYLRTQ